VFAVTIVLVILLHGFAGTAATWDDVLAAWPGGAPAARALALPGHGTPPPASWDDALDRLAAAIGDPGELLIGYSLGARLALGLLARDAIAAAILISVNPGLTTAAQRADRRAADAGWAALLRDRGTAAFADAWEAQPLFATAGRADPARRARRRAAREGLDPHALARALETTGLAEMPDYRAALAARAGRAHLVVGGDDARFVDLAGDAVAHAPSLLVEVIAGVGHDPTLENPDALASVLARAQARWSHR
jgi:2-succinyl-6-hydroxy-2,4-cyclohexadiene-1-carboxylate synthase